MEDEMRQIEQYRKMAAECERMAQAVNDETFRTMYSKFARQWREAAQKAEIADPVSNNDDLRAGRLPRVLNEFSTNGPSVHAVYPSSRYLSLKVRCFVEELLTAWRPEPPWDRPGH
jgi:hypothetical protein